MSNFVLSLNKWADKMEQDLHAVTRGTLINLMTAVTERSPVGNRELWAINQVRQMNAEMYQQYRLESGKSRVMKKTALDKFGGLKPKGYVGGRFRASWLLGMDSKPEGEPFGPSPPRKSYPDGAETVVVNAANIPQQAGGHVYYLVNNLPYAMALERGWSSQAPAGIAALTVLEFNDYFRKAAAAQGVKA